MSINTNVRMPSKSILIPMIRNLMPTLMANQITGVQPMTGHAGQIFSTDKTYVGGYNFNLKYWPHVTMVTWQHVLDAERWCYKNSTRVMSFRYVHQMTNLKPGQDTC